MQGQLEHDVGPVALLGFRADAQGFTNLPGTLALADADQNLPLTVAEQGVALGLLGTEARGGKGQLSGDSQN